jgi:hypothetical protein
MGETMDVPSTAETDRLRTLHHDTDRAWWAARIAAASALRADAHRAILEIDTQDATAWWFRVRETDGFEACPQGFLELHEVLPRKCLFRGLTRGWLLSREQPDRAAYDRSFGKASLQGVLGNVADGGAHPIGIECALFLHEYVDVHAAAAYIHRALDDLPALWAIHRATVAAADADRAWLGRLLASGPATPPQLAGLAKTESLDDVRQKNGLPSFATLLRGVLRAAAQGVRVRPKLLFKVVARLSELAPVDADARLRDACVALRRDNDDYAYHALALRVPELAAAGPPVEVRTPPVAVDPAPPPVAARPRELGDPAFARWAWRALHRPGADPLWKTEECHARLAEGRLFVSDDASGAHEVDLGSIAWDAAGTPIPTDGLRYLPLNIQAWIRAVISKYPVPNAIRWGQWLGIYDAERDQIVLDSGPDDTPFTTINRPEMALINQRFDAAPCDLTKIPSALYNQLRAGGSGLIMEGCYIARVDADWICVQTPGSSAELVEQTRIQSVLDQRAQHAANVAATPPVSADPPEPGLEAWTPGEIAAAKAVARRAPETLMRWVWCAQFLKAYFFSHRGWSVTLGSYRSVLQITDSGGVRVALDFDLCVALIRRKLLAQCYRPSPRDISLTPSMEAWVRRVARDGSTARTWLEDGGWTASYDAKSDLLVFQPPGEDGAVELLRRSDVVAYYEYLPLARDALVLAPEEVLHGLLEGRRVTHEEATSVTLDSTWAEINAPGAPPAIVTRAELSQELARRAAARAAVAALPSSAGEAAASTATARHAAEPTTPTVSLAPLSPEPSATPIAFTPRDVPSEIEAWIAGVVRGGIPVGASREVRGWRAVCSGTYASIEVYRDGYCVHSFSKRGAAALFGVAALATTHDLLPFGVYLNLQHAVRHGCYLSQPSPGWKIDTDDRCGVSRVFGQGRWFCYGHDELQQVLTTRQVSLADVPAAFACLATLAIRQKSSNGWTAERLPDGVRITDPFGVSSVFSVGAILQRFSEPAIPVVPLTPATPNPQEPVPMTSNRFNVSRLPHVVIAYAQWWARGRPGDAFPALTDSGDVNIGLSSWKIQATSDYLSLRYETLAQRFTLLEACAFFGAFLDWTTLPEAVRSAVSWRLAVGTTWPRGLPGGWVVTEYGNLTEITGPHGRWFFTPAELLATLDLPRVEELDEATLRWLAQRAGVWSGDDPPPEGWEWQRVGTAIAFRNAAGLYGVATPGEIRQRFESVRTAATAPTESPPSVADVSPEVAAEHAGFTADQIGCARIVLQTAPAAFARWVWRVGFDTAALASWSEGTWKASLVAGYVAVSSHPDAGRTELPHALFAWLLRDEPCAVLLAYPEGRTSAIAGLSSRQRAWIRAHDDFASSTPPTTLASDGGFAAFDPVLRAYVIQPRDVRDDMVYLTIDAAKRRFPGGSVRRAQLSALPTDLLARALTHDAPMYGSKDFFVQVENRDWVFVQTPGSDVELLPLWTLSDEVARRAATREVPPVPSATPWWIRYLYPHTGGSMTDPKTSPTMIKTLTADATEAAWRTAGSQFVRLVRDPMCGLLARHLGPDDPALRARIASFLETEIGTSLLAALLSAGLGTLPASAGNVPHRLARELRVRSMADAGNVVADVLMEPLRQVMQMYLQDLPAVHVDGLGDGTERMPSDVVEEGSSVVGARR